MSGQNGEPPAPQPGRARVHALTRSLTLTSDPLILPHDHSVPPAPPHLAPPPRGRGRRGLPVPGAGPGRAGPGARPSSTGSWPRSRTATWRCGGKLLADNGHAGRSPRRRRGAPGSGPGWPAGWAAGILLPMLLEEEGREVKGYLSLYRESPDGAAGPTALTLAKESKEHAETLASMSGAERRAVAQDRRRRLPPERGLRLQRRADRQLRPGRRHDRRPGQPRDGEHAVRGGRAGRDGGRRALDGLVRLPRRQERAGGVRARDRDGAGGDPADARARAGGAEPALSGEGHSRRRRPRRWPPRS